MAREASGLAKLGESTHSDFESAVREPAAIRKKFGLICRARFLSMALLHHGYTVMGHDYLEFGCSRIWGSFAKINSLTGFIRKSERATQS